MEIWIILALVIIAVISGVTQRYPKRGSFYQKKDDDDMLHPPGRYVLHDATGQALHVYRNLDDALLEARNVWCHQRALGEPYVIHEESGRRFRAREYETLVLPYMDDWE